MRGEIEGVVRKLGGKRYHFGTIKLMSHLWVKFGIVASWIIKASISGHRYSAEIISHAVWLYHRFTLGRAVRWYLAFRRSLYLDQRFPRERAFSIWSMAMCAQNMKTAWIRGLCCNLACPSTN